MKHKVCAICLKVKPVREFHVKFNKTVSRGCSRCTLSPEEEADEIQRLYGVARAANW